MASRVIDTGRQVIVVGNKYSKVVRPRQPGESAVVAMVGPDVVAVIEDHRRPVVHDRWTHF